MFNALKPSSLHRGPILLVAGISIFGFADTLTLFVSDQVGVGQFHFSRSLFAVVMILILSKFLRLSVVPQKWIPMLIRTFFMVTAILLFFSVVPMMPIAEAGAGLFTSPIFVLIFSFFFFRERISPLQILAVMVGTLGIALVLLPDLNHLSVYHLVPIISGASYALGSIITFRYLSDESPLAIIMSFIVSIGFCGYLLAISFTLLPASSELVERAPFLFSGWQGVDLRYWMWMALIAFCATLALCLMTRAYQITNTTNIAIYEYAYLISVGIFSYLIWDDSPPLISILGIFLIALAGVLISFVLPRTTFNSDAFTRDTNGKYL